jgi:hypothetical protein
MANRVTDPAAKAAYQGMQRLWQGLADRYELDITKLHSASSPYLAAHQSTVDLGPSA